MALLGDLAVVMGRRGERGATLMFPPKRPFLVTEATFHWCGHMGTSLPRGAATARVDGAIIDPQRLAKPQSITLTQTESQNGLGWKGH